MYESASSLAKGFPGAWALRPLPKLWDGFSSTEQEIETFVHYGDSLERVPDGTKVL
jgi:hypothetical protein